MFKYSFVLIIVGNVIILFYIIKSLAVPVRHNLTIRIKPHSSRLQTQNLSFQYPNICDFNETGQISEFEILTEKDEPNCHKFYKDNHEKIFWESAGMWFDRNSLENGFLSDLYGNCNAFLERQKYLINISQHKDEKNFKIAFTILAYTSLVQVERLLRTIFRPWNYYCIHVDIKSEGHFLKGINELVDCLNKKFGNIVNTKNRVNVVWGDMSVLTADLNCMKELLDRYRDWKYLINLNGQEFPLKTNLEIVQILKAYNGANNIDATYIYRHLDRFPITQMPFPLIWFKGEMHITANRAFVKFIFESEKAQAILNMIKNHWTPDETFYPTLNYNAQLRIPGSFIGNPDESRRRSKPLKYYFTRYKNWGQYHCRSRKFKRGVCIWGIRDLVDLVRMPHLFANKFYEDFEPATLRCIERFYYWKIVKEMKLGNSDINTSFYGSQPFVINQFRPANSTCL